MKNIKKILITKNKLIAKLNGKILSLIADKNEIIYASTTGTGTGYGFLYRVYKNSLTKIDRINGIVLSLATDNDNNLYASVVYHGENSNSKIFKITDGINFYEIENIINDKIRNLNIDKDGNIYAGSLNGNVGNVYKCLFKEKKFNKIFEVMIRF